jgi:hypothetical protein
MLKRMGRREGRRLQAVQREHAHVVWLDSLHQSDGIQDDD